MNTEEFRLQGKKMIDFICEYRNNLSKESVTPGDECKVNLLKKLIPSELNISVYGDAKFLLMLAKPNTFI